MARRAGNREHVLAVAESHMLDKGFGTTSIDEIIGASNLSRSGFFYHFKDRNALARALVERYIEQDDTLLDNLFDRARELHDDPLHAFLIALKLLSEMMADLPGGHPGCLVATFCYAERSFDREVRELNRQAMLGWRKRFADQFSEIAADHRPLDRATCETLADAFGTTIEGGIIVSRAAQQPRLLAEQILLLRSHVKLLFTSPRHRPPEASVTLPPLSSVARAPDGRTLREARRTGSGGKRERLLDIAETAVLTKGYSATSIEELIAEAGITKSGFFYHFQDKGELACALLARAIEHDGERLHACFADAVERRADPYGQLLLVLELLAGSPDNLDAGHRGSLVGTFCNTPGVIDERGSALLRQALIASREPFEAALTAVAARYPMSDDVELAALADRVFGTLEGGMVMAKALAEPDVFTAQVRLLRSYLELLFPDAPGSGA